MKSGAPHPALLLHFRIMTGHALQAGFADVGAVFHGGTLCRSEGTNLDGKIGPWRLLPFNARRSNKVAEVLRTDSRIGIRSK
jgi:hypothetical protein